MRKIPAQHIEKALESAVIQANISLEADILALMRNALKNEENEMASKILEILLQNAELSLKRRTPLCQDTGVGVVFVTMGRNILITDKPIKEAINQGIRNGYKNGSLRKSIVASPFNRVNTQDNTPAVIHFDMTEDDRLTIDFMAKGGGCENKSALKMLKPSDGWKGIKSFVLETVQKAGAAACPPFFIGVGIGGNFEMCALLSKKALLRDIGTFHKEEHIKKRELELLEQINELGIGPAGVKGNITAFSAAIEEAPCHIASLPVAVNIDCHSHRHRRIEL